MVRPASQKRLKTQSAQKEQRMEREREREREEKTSEANAVLPISKETNVPLDSFFSHVALI